MQNRALRFFLGVGRYTPNAAVNGDTGWDAVFQKQWQCVMSQWCRIKVMDQSRLYHRIHQWSVNHGNFRSKNWPYRIKQMMDESNVGDLFSIGSENINKTFITNRINEHIKTQDNQIWINDVTRPDARQGNGRNSLELINFSKLHMRKKIMLKLSRRETTEERSQNLEWE